MPKIDLNSFKQPGTCVSNFGTSVPEMNLNYVIFTEEVVQTKNDAGGVARVFPGRRVAHPENQIEEENEER